MPLDHALEAHWHVVETLTGWEEMVARRIARGGIEVYCPLEERRLQRRGRVRRVRAPWLPGYLFVRLTRPALLLSDRRGVIGLLRGAGEIAILPDGLVETIRARADTDGVIRARRAPDVSFGAGERVRVIDGAWTGLVGEVVRLSGAARVRVLIGTLNADIAATRLAKV
jgi:transcription antitermination factor NusG